MRELDHQKIVRLLTTKIGQIWLWFQVKQLCEKNNWTNIEQKFEQIARETIEPIESNKTEQITIK